ncbi:hypothetical protein [Elioraea sp.]|uniref:hypothetical protein n=1 Tax=Elioraea sp. TaxID=2185103 RepID=UPI0025BD3883|nr:hypothetical protein [Elioraea sp.]
MQDSESPGRPRGKPPSPVSSPALTEAGREARAARDARSAAALRENLIRRKAQARARTGPAEPRQGS